MGIRDEMQLRMTAIAENEYFARVTVAAFAAKRDPTMEELADIKTAVSEAVTNAVVHAYEGHGGPVCLTGRIEEEWLYLEITDAGIGIADIRQAMEPLYTSKPDSVHAGMGFSFMEAFMDEVEVASEIGRGTTVRMKKRICQHADSKTMKRVRL
jgi:stage II sporulation protein AB (anti-sigma F factor)